jgi:hypothetical protein
VIDLRLLPCSSMSKSCHRRMLRSDRKVHMAAYCCLSFPWMLLFPKFSRFSDDWSSLASLGSIYITFGFLSLLADRGCRGGGGREERLQLMLLHIYAWAVWPAGRPQCALNDRFMPDLYFTQMLCLWCKLFLLLACICTSFHDLILCCRLWWDL